MKGISLNLGKIREKKDEDRKNIKKKERNKKAMSRIGCVNARYAAA